MNKNEKSQGLSWTIAANTTLTVVEFIAGFWTGSLSLISDATHNSVDILTLVIAYIADRVSRHKATQTHSYGYQRIGILASLLNSLILAGIAFYIFWSAYLRLQNPQPVEGGWIVIVSIFAIAVNGFSAYMISKNKKDLNIKSAYLNMFFDALASVGTLFAGLIIIFTKWYWVDSVISIGIGILLLRGSVEILRKATEILLEAVPKEIDIEKVKTTILEHTCVYKIVDLHIWSITAENMILTAVIEINPVCLHHLDYDIVKLKRDLKAKYNIYHQTIEARIQALEHED